MQGVDLVKIRVTMQGPARVAVLVAVLAAPVGRGGGWAVRCAAQQKRGDGFYAAFP